MNEEPRVFDLKRIFLGDLDPVFALEVAFRTGFMFVFTVTLVRLLGKRGIGQLSPFEFVIIIALGSAVGDPMFYPDVPLFHAMVVVTVIVLLQRALVGLTDRSEKMERYIESEPRLLVHEGVLDMDALKRERFARDELFTALREEGVEQLGQVKRAYLEPSGHVSVWKLQGNRSRPGLPILPRSDPDFAEPVPGDEPAPFAGLAACANCGSLAEAGAGRAMGQCRTCEETSGWLPASDSAPERTNGAGGPVPRPASR